MTQVINSNWYIGAGVKADGVTILPFNVDPNGNQIVTLSSTGLASAANIATASGSQSIIATNPGNWAAVSAPAAATQATATKAAGGAGVRHVCNSISATIACGATAQTPINVYLRDGAAGAGAIIWAGAAAAPVNGTAVICMTELNIFGSANTAMTLEFSAAGVAASVEAVTLGGYDVS